MRHQLEELCRNLRCSNAATATFGMSSVGAVQTTSKHLCSFSSLQIPILAPHVVGGHHYPVSVLPGEGPGGDLSHDTGGCGWRQLSCSSAQAGTTDCHAARTSVSFASAFNEPVSCWSAVTSGGGLVQEGDTAGGLGCQASLPKHMLIQRERYWLFLCVRSPCQIQLSSRRLLCF